MTFDGFLMDFLIVTIRDVESESESESESVGIGSLAGIGIGIGIGKKFADSDSGQIKPHAALVMLLRQNYHVIMSSWMCLSIRFRKHSTSFKKKLKGPSNISWSKVGNFRSPPLLWSNVITFTHFGDPLSSLNDHDIFERPIIHTLGWAGIGIGRNRNRNRIEDPESESESKSEKNQPIPHPWY